MPVLYLDFPTLSFSKMRDKFKLKTRTAIEIKKSFNYTLESFNEKMR